MSLRKRFIIAYDISDNRKRNKIFNLLKDYNGNPLQKSVFECMLKKESLTELSEKIVAVIDRKEDSVIIFPLCKMCNDNKLSLGIKVFHVPRDFLIL